jgi:hypothetical protein
MLIDLQARKDKVARAERHGTDHDTLAIASSEKRNHPFCRDWVMSKHDGVVATACSRDLAESLGILRFLSGRHDLRTAWNHGRDAEKVWQ